MAVIINKDKAQERQKKYQLYRGLFILGFGVSGLAFLLFALLVVGRFMFLLAPILMPLFLGGAIMGGYFHQKAQVLSSGLEGEKYTAFLMAALPEGYYGFQNIHFDHEGISWELDMVIVGYSGIFIIETKNMNGTIEGHWDAPFWTQHKIGRQGTPYSKQFKSPVKQVGKQTWHFSQFMKAKGITTYIDKMVFFSNPQTHVHITGSGDIPVFAASAQGADAMGNYILNGRQRLTRDAVLKIANFLSSM